MLRWLRPLHFASAPCFDFAGIVSKTSTGVTGWERWDRIFGMLLINSLGATGESVVVESSYVCRLPEGLDFKPMEGLLLAGLTAFQALRDQGQPKSGQKLLVIGGRHCRTLWRADRTTAGRHRHRSLRGPKSDFLPLTRRRNRTELRPGKSRIGKSEL